MEKFFIRNAKERKKDRVIEKAYLQSLRSFHLLIKTSRSIELFKQIKIATASQYQLNTLARFIKCSIFIEKFRV